MSKFFDGELLSGYEESPKTTIFGEEHFIDTAMIKLVQQKNEAVDNYIFEQMANSLKGSVLVEMPQVIIDKEKLKKWVVLCMKLENIEHSELVDMATKKRIADLEAKLSESDKELKLAQKLHTELFLSYEKLKDNNEQLKQQLAEKDAERELDNSFWKQECDSLQKALAEKEIDLSLARNEIDTLKHNLNISQKHDNVMCEQYFEKCKQHNQDKISFAVERLEEVKEICKEIPRCDEYGDDWVHQSSLFEHIDNKIKAIKGDEVE